MYRRCRFREELTEEAADVAFRPIPDAAAERRGDGHRTLRRLACTSSRPDRDAGPVRPHDRRHGFMTLRRHLRAPVDERIGGYAPDDSLLAGSPLECADWTSKTTCTASDGPAFSSRCCGPQVHHAAR